jgi:hypothetical protein
MEVDEKVQPTANHSIEWGKATWDKKDKSIRNRYDTPAGKFNKAGSSEIPWEDFKTMISESIKRGKFSNSELADIMNDISNHLKTL